MKREAEEHRQRGWFHPHERIQYRRETESRPTSISHTLGQGDQRPKEPTPPPAHLLRERERSRPARSPTRSPNRESGAWWWDNGRWVWTWGAWSSTSWGARGDDSSGTPLNADSSSFSTLFTAFLLIAGTIILLHTVRQFFIQLILHYFTSQVGEVELRKSGGIVETADKATQVGRLVETTDQAIQVGDCTGAIMYVYTTPHGECIHFFPDCDTFYPSSRVQDRTICSKCSARFDEHYKSTHPDARFCRTCLQWVENEQAYVAHLTSRDHIQRLRTLAEMREYARRQNV